MNWTQLLSDRRLGATRTERPQSRGWARSDFERDYEAREDEGNFDDASRWYDEGFNWGDDGE